MEGFHSMERWLGEHLRPKSSAEKRQRVLDLIGENVRLREERDRAQRMLDVCGTALAQIDTGAQLPRYVEEPYAQAEWWKHLASKRREVARDALAKLNELSKEARDG